jgi:TonB-linked SusC/RagA family outer membrane protein
MYVFNKESLNNASITTDAGLVKKMVAEGTDATKSQSFEEFADYGYNMMVRPSLTYVREFGRHSVDAILLYEQYSGRGRYLNIQKKGYYSNYPLSINMGDSWPTDLSGIQSNFSQSGKASLVGRVNYAFDKKYLASLSFRYDGTHVFAPRNRWGFFPSASVGWIMSEENFIKDADTPINFLKVTASYGETGNNSASAWQDLQLYNTTLPNYSSVFGGIGRPAYYSAGYVYPFLTWATMRAYDVGFDAELWQGKLGVEFHWFYNLTTDILQIVSGDYSPSLGGNVPAQKNSGSMDNRGLELTLRHSNSFSNGWAYNITGSLTWAHNRVLERVLTDDHSTIYQRTLGNPVGTIYGLKAIGLYQTQEDIDNSPYGPASDKRLGDIMYADINGNGVIDISDVPGELYMDEVKIGNSVDPEMTFSLNASVSWKGLSLTTMWYGVAITSYLLSGRYNSGVPDATMQSRPFYANGNAPYYIVENSWREDNRDALWPRLSTDVSNSTNAWPSSWWVKNGAYLRLREAALSYELPSNLLRNTGIGGVRLTLSGQNLFTISAYKYVDPETPSVNNGYYPQRRTYSLGVDLTF